MLPEISTDQRPPYVTFERRAVEDRNASIAAGHYVTKDVDFAVITPQGTRDRIERIVEDWFKGLAEQVRDNRVPQLWLTGYKSWYDQWKAGEELTLNGTPLKTWPVASPAQVANCITMRLLTVEDLATAGEDVIQRLGLSFADLQRRAKSWLASAGDQGKLVAELSALRVERDALKQRTTELEELLREAESTLKRLQPARAK